MIIMSLNGTNIINMDCVENIFLGADRKSIKANMTSRSGCELAKYSNYEQCKYALEALFIAVKGEDRVFQFPREEDMNHARQYSSHITSRTKSHGGS